MKSLPLFSLLLHLVDLDLTSCTSVKVNAGSAVATNVNGTNGTNYSLVQSPNGVSHLHKVEDDGAKKTVTDFKADSGKDKVKVHKVTTQKGGGGKKVDDYEVAKAEMDKELAEVEKINKAALSEVDKTQKQLQNAMDEMHKEMSKPGT